MRISHRWLAAAVSTFALASACGGGSDGGTGPGGGGGSTAFTAKIDGQAWATDAARLQVLAGSPGVPGSIVIVGTRVSGTSTVSIQLVLGYVRFPAIYPLGVNSGTTPGGTATITETSGTSSEIRTTPLDGESGTFTVSSNDGSHIKGTFTFVAQPLLGSLLTGNRTVTEGTFDLDLPAGFTVPDNVNFGSDMMADLNGDHFYSATAVALGANGAFSFGGTTTTLGVQIVNSTVVNGATTLNLLNGVTVTVLDFTTGHSWGGISGDVGSVHFAGVGARINGEFSGTLQPNAASGATGTLTIANGSFNMRVDAP
jgi:hypothetical protein